MTPFSRRTIIVLVAVAGSLVPATSPFAIGEVLQYQVAAGRFRGDGTLSLTDGGTIRGTPVALAQLRVTAGFGPIKGTHLTESWFDMQSITSFRYHDREHRLFSTRDRRVEIDPASRKWTDSNGLSDSTTSGQPLDELSFIYFIRTLDLTPGAVYQTDRFFDPQRTPTIVRVLIRDTTRVPAGAFPTVLVSMTVKDPRRFGSRLGTLLIHFTDDSCRLPVRMESTTPDGSHAVLSLREWTHPGAVCEAPIRDSTVDRGKTHRGDR